VALHLANLAQAPRFTGTPAAEVARRYCAEVLRSVGYQVSEQPFEYSAIVGSYGTPIGGGAVFAVVVAAAALSLGNAPVTALAVLLGGLSVVGAAGRWAAREGVLTLPVSRRVGVNLEARRAADAPTLWLVAHIDSKSQPVPLAARAAGIVLLTLAWLAAVALVIEGWMGNTPRRGWVFVAVLAAAGALPVLGSIVGERSAGAVDNASGVAAVLRAAALVPANARVGVLITDAEELGLAGARAWCKGRQAGVALNCDGVDDAGLLTLMWTRPRSPRLERALAAASADAGERLRVIPLVPGVLVDGLAFSDAGWDAVTLSRGSIETLRRIHTVRDDLTHLRGDGVELAARTLARAAVTLTEQG
jgi:hypothetical protein